MECVCVCACVRVCVCVCACARKRACIRWTAPELSPHRTVLFDCAGEEQLLRYYHTRLTSLLSGEDAAGYSLDTARRHYQLCLLDYGRVVMSCFCACATASGHDSFLFVGCCLDSVRSFSRCGVGSEQGTGRVKRRLPPRQRGRTAAWCTGASTLPCGLCGVWMSARQCWSATESELLAQDRDLTASPAVG